MNKLLKTLLTSFLTLLLCLNIASAQSLMESDADVVSQKVDFDIINSKIQKIEEAVKNEDFSQGTIDSYVSFLNEQETSIVEHKKYLEKQIRYIQKQLDALGEAPQDGQTEDNAITNQRNNLTRELTSYDRLIKEADLLTIKIENLVLATLNARSKKVYGSLMTRQAALINPVTFFTGIKSYIIFFWDVVKSPIVWYREIPQEERRFTILNIISMAFILAIALTLAVFLRKYILNHWGYKKDIKLPRFSRKVVAAAAVATSRGLIPAFLIGGCILWMVSTKIFNDSLLGRVLLTTSLTSLLAIAEATVARVTFAPHYEQWRLVNVPTDKAATFTRMLFLFIFLNAILITQVSITKEANYSIETVHFILAISCAVKAFFLAWFAKLCFETFRQKEEKAVPATTGEDDEDDFAIDDEFKFTLLINFFCLIVFLLSLFGYPELSSFILKRIIFSLVICGIYELLRRSVIDMVKRLFLAGPWMKSIRINKRIIGKIEFWIKTLLNPVLILMLFFTLLNVWGLPGDFMLQTAKKLLFGFKIGSIQISLIAITLGIVVFFGSLTLVRILKKHLSNNVLDKIEMDDGIKNSLISGVGFVGFIISTLLAIIAVGIDLTNLAFIAGALSVGIGFGLQDVIKNLVAGIIILFERPFKVGDWVILNGTEGKIKQINIRSTEMECFNRTSVIVPNATLISNSVTNLTHGDNISRQSVKVGVAYGSDVEKVRAILLECASKHKYVMKNPAPYVLFQDFDASSLLFELRCYTNDIWKGWGIPSDLRYEINRRFIEENIEIPFQQVVIHKADKTEEEPQQTKKKTQK